MTCERVCMYVFFAAVIVHTACGVPGAGDLTVTGIVDLGGAGEVRGPVFVAVTATNDYDVIENDPVTNVLGVVRTENNGSFTADLGEMGVIEGEDVHLIAFADNDYSEGVPYPTAGDVLGFYFDRERWSTALTAVAPGVQGIVISVNRPVRDFTARVSGTVTGGGGDLIIIAYRGALESMNPDDINVDNIIGYLVIQDAPESASYSLRIFPFGAAPPLDDVHIIVLNDRNRNGIPDGGDRIGVHSRNKYGIPSGISINEGNNEGVDIALSMELHDPFDGELCLEGRFDVPAGIGDSDEPVYVLALSTSDPGRLFTDPVPVVREFRRLGAGENSFSMDLSRSGLRPGDNIMVVALQDRDNGSGFPVPSPGDAAGFWMNTAQDTMSFTVSLGDGTTVAEPGGDCEFSINRLFHDYNTEIQFTVDPKDPDGVVPDGLGEGASLIAVVIHENGVNLLGQITDLSYVLAMKRLTMGSDPSHVYSVTMFPAIDYRIADPSSMNVYIALVYDRDGDGMPTVGVDDIAAYSQDYFFIGTIPVKWKLQGNAVNVPDRPVNFLGKKFGDILLF